MNLKKRVVLTLTVAILTIFGVVLDRVFNDSEEFSTTNLETVSVPVDLMGTILDFNTETMQLKETNIFSNTLSYHLGVGHDIYDTNYNILELNFNEETRFRFLEAKGLDILNSEETGKEKLSVGKPVVVFTNLYETEFVIESILIYNFID